MRLLLATDAWFPQVNGVVTTLSTVMEELRQMGHTVEVIHPGLFPTIPLPSYSEIKLALWKKGLWKRVETFDPDAIHIATEGPIGWKVRNECVRRGLAFTTSLHTRFPEYVAERAPIPLSWSYAVIRRFHRPATRTLVATPSFRDVMADHGLEHLQVWGRGVDVSTFNPEHRAHCALSKPVMLYAGRIAAEKNLHAFLDLDVPGTKIMVGDGPQTDDLKAQYPDAVFVGYKYGKALAHFYASADVFVFPSMSDTFGLVMLESIACGTPVAAFPVTGPVDVVKTGVNGCLDDDLGVAIQSALKLDRQRCAASAQDFTWKKIANDMLGAFTPLNTNKQSAFESVCG